MEVIGHQKKTLVIWDAMYVVLHRCPPLCGSMSLGVLAEAVMAEVGERQSYHCFQVPADILPPDQAPAMLLDLHNGQGSIINLGKDMLSQGTLDQSVQPSH